MLTAQWHPPTPPSRWHTLGNSAVDGVLGHGAHSYGVIDFFTSGRARRAGRLL